MNSEDRDEGRAVHGHVKWFDPAKGFGFVIADDGGPDILLHANVLRNFGQSSVADGSGIEVTVQHTDRGVQAVAVVSIRPPDSPVGPGLSDLVNIDPETLANRPLEPARVKWFDKSKGFGFANVFGLDEDVFVHIEIVRKSGLADLQPGEAVCLRIIDGKRGRMATEVLAWDSAVRDSTLRDSAGRDSAGRDSGGRDSGGRDSGGRESVGAVSAGRDPELRDSALPDPATDE